MLDPLKDGKSKIELVNYMGGDLDIVNDARASFEKSSQELNVADIKLLNYLIEHNHFSPLRGTVFKFKVKAPLMVARQWWKHSVSSSHTESQLQWNEKSLRYVAIEDDGDFYTPSSFRQQSKSNRQATEGEIGDTANMAAVATYENQCRLSFQAYQGLLALGVGREQARGILVPSVYTSWVWTASLQSVLNFISLRQGKGAQGEITAYADAVSFLIKPIVSETMKAWSKYQ
jgi:thymidylate synthase (FAD)